MPQIFTASADTRLRTGLLMVVLVFFGSTLFIGGFMDSSYVTSVGWVVD